MNTQGYDLIGDIHGQYDKLAALLRHLDYQKADNTWKHPEGRKVIFLGDYVDRGTKGRKVLQTVRGMCDAGDALAIMGNHEYNAVCFATPDGNGGWLRKHDDKNILQVQATTRAFAGLEEEWAEWLEWMKRLPMFLDLGVLRCVHACWDAKLVRLLEGKSLMDTEFLRLTATKTTPEHRAIENVLKGPEVPASDGNMFRDKEGTYRSTVRARWWNIREGLTIGEIAMPPGSMRDDCAVDQDQLWNLPNYEANEPPVFFGHYWMPPDAPKTHLAPNIACLDFSAGLTGPLVAYRWDGETTLDEGKFVMAEQDTI